MSRNFGEPVHALTEQLGICELTLSGLIESKIDELPKVVAARSNLGLKLAKRLRRFWQQSGKLLALLIRLVLLHNNFALPHNKKGTPHMSEIKLYLLDSHSCISATVHGSVGDALVAALSTEPETIEDLESALSRFQACTTIPASSLIRIDRCEIDDTPYDAGILVIDLAARIVSCESTYSLPGPRGTVQYHDGTQCTEIYIEYHLSDDWMFLRSIEEYQATCQVRLMERAASARSNTRTSTNLTVASCPSCAGK